jgi:hypothetical protein
MLTLQLKIPAISTFQNRSTMSWNKKKIYESLLRMMEMLISAECCTFKLLNSHMLIP